MVARQSTPRLEVVCRILAAVHLALEKILETSLIRAIARNRSFHAQRDSISEGRAMLAMERIGASPVFEYVEKHFIPGSKISVTLLPEFDLAPVLRDWSP